MPDPETGVPGRLPQPEDGSLRIGGESGGAQFPTATGAITTCPPASWMRPLSRITSGVAKYTVHTVGIRPSALWASAATASPSLRAHTEPPYASSKVHPKSSP